MRKPCPIPAGLLAAFLLSGPLAQADDVIRMKAGTSLRGKIVSESDTEVVIRTSSGTMTLPRSSIKSVTKGAPPAAARSSDSSVAPGKSSEYGLKEPPSDFVHQGPQEDLVVSVGPGGIPRKLARVGLMPSRDYAFYAARIASRVGKPPAELSVEERRQAVVLGVRDELLFQAALADGTLKDPYCRWVVIETWRNHQTVGKVSPDGITDAEAEAYYRDHPEQFMTPAEVLLDRLAFSPDATPGVIAQAVQDASERPDSIQQWERVGWVKGDAKLPKDFLGAVTSLKAGQASSVIQSPSGQRAIFRCRERKEPQQMPYDAGRVRFAMLGARVGEMAAELLADAKGDPAGLGEEETLFRRALRAGTAREAQIFLRIVNTWLDGKKLPADPEKVTPELLDGLRKRFPIKRVVDEPPPVS